MTTWPKRARFITEHLEKMFGFSIWNNEEQFSRVYCFTRFDCSECDDCSHWVNQ